MKLYMVPLAPNPTKVMLYIAERESAGTDMGIEQVFVNTLKGRHREPEHLARNPFGTLPVLELEDGSHLVESLSIIEYLEEVKPEQVMQQWQETLPPGFRLLSAHAVPVSDPSLSQRLASAHWQFSLHPAAASASASPEDFAADVVEGCRALLAGDQLIWNDTDKKKRPRQRDCKPFLLDLTASDLDSPASDGVVLQLHAAIDAMGRSLKPTQIQHWLSEEMGMELQLKQVQRRALLLEIPKAPVLD